MTEAEPTALELVLAAEDVALLLRQPELRTTAGKARRTAAPRATRISVIWHDTPDGSLADQGLALAERRIGTTLNWQIERIVANAAAPLPPGAPTAVVEPYDTAAAPLDKPAAMPHLPVAAFEGQQRLLLGLNQPVQVTLLQGTLRAVAATQPVCRLLLSGDNPMKLATAWATKLRLAVPIASLAAEAFTLANRPLPHRPLGAPALTHAHTVDDGFALVVAHLAGVIQHHAPNARLGHGLEPVHQMRVALRRLRSAILLFRRAVDCPELDSVNAGLRQLAALLGPARDWDVFIAGTGHDVGEAFAGDPAITALLASAAYRRRSSYAALGSYLGGADWRGLGIALADMALRRPWRHFIPDDPEVAARQTELQQTTLANFGARALSRRLDAVTAPGADLSHLDVAALHGIRLHTKRLRYACEFFAPLFPGRETRRFLERMMELQEKLGTLNDAVVAADLMRQLKGRSAARHYAAGVVRGFVAARSAGSRRKINRFWQRFRRQEPFWK